MASSRTPLDIIRQSANLVLVPLVILLSSLPQMTGTGRQIADQASTEQNLLVPVGFAFSIWGPIFIGIILYALYQALPRQGARDVHRAAGWWTALGFAFICGWCYFTSYSPIGMKDWGSAVMISAGALSLVTAMLGLTRRWIRLSTPERAVVWLPISAIAGWMSIAQFLNWNSTLRPYYLDWGWSETGASLAVLGLALWFVSFCLSRAAGNRAYVIPVLWGLSLLVLARLTGHKGLYDTPIAIAAGVAVIILLVISIQKGRGARRRIA